MTSGDIGPNLLFGLREGLEAGLVVSVLLAAVRRAAPALAGSRRARRIPTAPVWLGALGAVALSGSCAAVLTSSAVAASGQVQNVVGGVLSVFAVALITAMICWMRRAATAMTARLRGDQARVAPADAGALTMTAFLTVGRDGLATTLFLWTAARAPGQRAGPLAGAAAGLAAAAVICWLVYRAALRLKAGLLFDRAAPVLIVIAAGVFASGLGELQAAGLLAGRRWIAFDITAHAHPGSWWVSVITGITGLSPTMTVLQVVAWVAYLAVVIGVFARAGRPGAAPRSATAASASRWQRLAGHRPWTVAGALVAVPAVAAGSLIAALPAAGSAAAPAVTVTVTRTGCAPGWTAASAGPQTFTVENQSGLPGEINLDDASGDIVAEIETIGAGTSAQLSATLYSGTYVFKCFMGSLQGTVSQPVQVTGGGNAASATPTKGTAVAIKPVTVGELAGPNRQYLAYAAEQLADLAQAVSRIQAGLRRDDLSAARQDWLAAQLDWERVGASYDSFGDLGLAVDGLPDGLPDGVNDRSFTGLHRLEYGLWHGQSAATLVPVAEALASNVAAVRRNLASDDLAGDPANLPVRAHEILEDALRDHLSGIDDEGAGAAFAMTYADVAVTTAVLGYLAPLINARQPGLPAIADSELSILQGALLTTRVNGQWESLAAASLTAREHVDAAVDAVLETLAAVPDLLEVPPAH